MILLNRWSSALVNPKKQRAIAAVEFALVAPLLAVLFMGMMELSRALMVKVTLSDAARKACRTGIQRDKGNNDITNEVINIMNDNGYDTTRFNPPSLGSITINVTDPNGVALSDSLDAPSGSTVSVQVSIPVSSTTWVTQVFLPDGSFESETVVMMKQ
jgi:Flp pilus assembly protein TadG